MVLLPIPEGGLSVPLRFDENRNGAFVLDNAVDTFFVHKLSTIRNSLSGASEILTIKKLAKK